jgi:hypothetical protein
MAGKLTLATAEPSMPIHNVIGTTLPLVVRIGRDLALPTARPVVAGAGLCKGGFR